MGVRIDRSQFDTRWDLIRDRLATLPGVLLEEVALLGMHVMVEHVPVDSGFLTSSVSAHESGTTWYVSPWAWYAYYPRYYGKRKKRYDTTYVERTKAAMTPLIPDVIGAKTKEHLQGG